MWLMVAGRLSQPIAEEIKHVLSVPIIGVENVGDLCYTLDVQGNGAFRKVTGIVVVDPSLQSLKDWNGVMEMANRLSQIPVHVANRFSQLTPSQDTFPQNVQIHLTGEEGQVSVSQLAGIVAEGEAERKAQESMKKLEEQFIGEEDENR
ncbi:hypothetical protein [Bacillus thuringiensis]|uniref:hypothetical protein n=1 Tax=Bacillus thuringiensis TaxID=1428 RepID=UPI000BFBB82B|nr:hypothetical protein [Bacillus thuringiensis]PGT90063.1 hypothetical protein COD17_09950 [Bacillus thuringiensis]